MSGFLFLLVVDWVMKRTVEHAGTGIRWKITGTTLEDFADDLALISSTFKHIQITIYRLNSDRKGTGLKISTKKTKIMRINAKNSNAVVVDGQKIKDVDGVDHLGARIIKHGGSEDDIKSRLGKTTETFNKLTKIWRSGQLSKNTKIMIFKSNPYSTATLWMRDVENDQRDEVMEFVKNILADEGYERRREAKS